MAKQNSLGHVPLYQRRSGEVFYDYENSLWGFTCAPQKTVLASDGYQRAIGRSNAIWTANKPLEGGTYTDLGADLFTQFYFPSVENLAEENVPEERALSHTIIQWFKEQQTYQGFQGQTYDDSMAASLAAGTAWQVLTSDVILQQIFKIQEELEQAKQQMAAAGLDPNESEEEGQGAGNGTPQQQQAREALAQARAKVAKAQDTLNNNAVAQASVQGKIGKAVAEGIEKGSQTRDMLNALAWGDEDGTPSSQEVKPVLDFMKRNGKWIEALLAVIGRARHTALRAARAAANTHYPIITTGFVQELPNLTPQELGALGSENVALATMAALDFFDRGLLGWKQKSDWKDEGFFTLSADVSGSMGHEEFMIATGVALGLAKAAREQSRKYSLYKFDTQITARVNSEQGWKKHLEWTASNSGGGTSFNPPLSQMADDLEKALASAEGPTRGMDAVIISDGYASLNDATRTRWEKLKKQGVRLLYIAVGQGTGVLESLASKTLELHTMNLENGDLIAAQVGTWLAD